MKGRADTYIQSISVSSVRIPCAPETGTMGEVVILSHPPTLAEQLDVCYCPKRELSMDVRASSLCGVGPWVFEWQREESGLDYQPLEEDCFVTDYE